MRPEAPTWEWLAGFFDGEGSINMCMGGNRATVSCTLTQAGTVGLKVLTDVRLFLQGQGISSCLVHRQRPKSHWTTCHELRLGGRVAVMPFLRGLFPHLKIKKVKAQDVLRY